MESTLSPQSPTEEIPTPQHKRDEELKALLSKCDAEQRHFKFWTHKTPTQTTMTASWAWSSPRSTSAALLPPEGWGGENKERESELGGGAGYNPFMRLFLYKGYAKIFWGTLFVLWFGVFSPYSISILAACQWKVVNPYKTISWTFSAIRFQIYMFWILVIKTIKQTTILHYTIMQF